MNTPSIKKTLAMVVAAAVLWPRVPVLAEEVAVAPAPVMVTTESATTPSPAFSILQAVRTGRAMLKQQAAARLASGGTVTVASKPQTADITLAVWEKGTDRITLVEAEKSGTTVKVKTPGNWPIRVTYNNRHLSQYALPASRNALVVGVRYPAALERLEGKKKVYDLQDLVYVPYQADFYVPEVLTAGSDYLSHLIQDAFDELQAKGIKSRAYPDRLVVDVIDPYLIKSIAVIEHSDHGTLLGDDEPERALGRFLVKLALNEEDAFSAAISTAGAAGLVQFIPSTYKLYVDRRPDLGLIPDFRAGMADHRNAVKAEVAYLDQSLAGMPKAIRDIYAGDKTKAAEFLAAAYNGGESRVKKAFAAFGEDWSQEPAAQLASLNSRSATLKSRIAMFKDRIKRGKWPVENGAALKEAEAEQATVLSKITALKSSALRQETAIYVAKLRKTYSLLSSGAFATPTAPSGALPVATASRPPTVVPSALAVVCFGDGSCSAR